MSIDDNLKLNTEINGVIDKNLELNTESKRVNTDNPEYTYSFIIPLFNRPQEIKELLDTLAWQTRKNFEVLVIEDGSTRDAETVVSKYKNVLDISYFKKENSGQGFSRNYGFERAKGDFFIILDSDVLLPPDYLEAVNRGIKTRKLDSFGGPDAAHESFSPIQKAISYAMTSFFTTGGIRGKKNNLGGTFHPRSFNMGISRKVYQATGGFIITRLGEDIEFSIRLQQMGFKAALIADAVVYHKRRTSMNQFYHQLHFFGRARINIYTFFPKTLKPVHFFPSVFTAFLGLIALSFMCRWYDIFNLSASILLLYALAILIDAAIVTKSLYIAYLSVIASFIQLVAYGIGFTTDYFKRVVFKVQ